MSLREESGKGGRRRLGVGRSRGVLVAVKASMNVPRDALVWALTHVVLPGDSVKLLVVIPDHQSSSRKLWGIQRFGSDCASTNWNSFSGTPADQKDYITDSCAQLVLQLNHLFDPNKVRLKIKVISGSDCGIVAAEAKKTHSHWVVLDKRMKKEAKSCVEELECNVVIMMKKSHPKVLRLNLLGSPSCDIRDVSGSETFRTKMVEEELTDTCNEIQVPNATPVSSPDHKTSIDAARTSSSVSGYISEINWDIKKIGFPHYPFDDESDTNTDSENLCSSPSTTMSSKQWTSDTTFSLQRLSANNILSTITAKDEPHVKFFEEDQELKRGVNDGIGRSSMELTKSLRKIATLSNKALLEPPPLCSMCQRKAPVFGKPPRWFKFAELENATNGFCQDNFLAEGGYGSVHRGVLPDGQAIAVKQYKSTSSQGDHEFCSEVEVLSCAQHRNVVLLIGFCVEDGRRLLVYEYICNGSLDAHLYGRKKKDPLSWPARQRIAIGAARGLRYLHEECRVGCIVHRDMRPNNILLTHDFEPMVGDFGLARWQPDGDLGVQTRVIGTFGYLAPEYAQSGEITEKADVYSFGVILVGLITGRKAMDVNRPKGQQSLTEWARPLLEKSASAALLDPFLMNCGYVEEEVYSMMHCAALCIQRDPLSRPRMSQVLRMLECDT